jgi:hypothetical protein
MTHKVGDVITVGGKRVRIVLIAPHWRERVVRSGGQTVRWYEPDGSMAMWTEPLDAHERSRAAFTEGDDRG